MLLIDGKLVLLSWKWQKKTMDVSIEIVVEYQGIYVSLELKLDFLFEYKEFSEMTTCGIPTCVVLGNYEKPFPRQAIRIGRQALYGILDGKTEITVAHKKNGEYLNMQ